MRKHPLGVWVLPKIEKRIGTSGIALAILEVQILFKIACVRTHALLARKEVGLPSGARKGTL